MAGTVHLDILLDEARAEQARGIAHDDEFDVDSLEALAADTGLLERPVLLDTPITIEYDNTDGRVVARRYEGGAIKVGGILKEMVSIDLTDSTEGVLPQRTVACLLTNQTDSQMGYCVPIAEAKGYDIFDELDGVQELDRLKRLFLTDTPNWIEIENLLLTMPNSSLKLQLLQGYMKTMFSPRDYLLHGVFSGSFLMRSDSESLLPLDCNLGVDINNESLFVLLCVQEFRFLSVAMGIRPKLFLPLAGLVGSVAVDKVSVVA